MKKNMFANQKWERQKNHKFLSEKKYFGCLNKPDLKVVIKASVEYAIGDS